MLVFGIGFVRFGLGWLVLSLWRLVFCALGSGLWGFGFWVPGGVLAPACGWLLPACWHSDLVCLDGLLPVLVSRGVDIIHIV